MGDFANFEVIVTVTNQYGSEVVSKSATVLDIPWDVELKDAADGLTELIDRADLEEWFINNKMMEQR